MPKMPDETALGTVQPISPGVVQGPRDYIGVALQSVGGDLMQIGARAKAEAEKKKNEDDALDLGRARADWNSRRLLEDDNYRLDKDSDYGKWEPKFQKNIKAHQEASANLIRDPKVREKFQIETEDDITRGTLSVRDRSGAIDRGKKEAEFLQGIDTNMRLAGAPGTDDKTRDEITARTRADIDNAVTAGLLDPAKAIEIRQKFVKGISVFRVQRDIEADPEGAYRNLKGNSGEIYFHKLSGKESGHSDTVKASTSSATGRYQFTSGTWAQVMKNHPELGLTADGRTSRSQQERAIRAFTADNAAVLEKNGLPQTEANLYLAHFMGVGGAVEMLKANPNASAADLFSEAAKANPTIFFNKTGQPRTVEQVIALQTKGFSGAGGPAPDYYQFVDADDRLRLEASAEAEFTRRDRVAKEDNALERYQMSNLLEDDLTQLEMTGKGQDIDPAMVANTLGDAKAAEWLDRRSEAAASYAVVESIDGLSNEDITKHLDELQPEEGSPDYAKQARLYDKALSRSAKVLAEREKDPAKAVAKAPMVKAALENFDPQNPQSHQALVKARLAAQDSIGIPGVLQNPVTREDAAQLFAPIVKALDREDAEMAIAKGSSTPAERRASVKEIKAATQAEMKKAIDNIETLYGPYAGQVLTQAIAQNFRNQNDANLMANVLRKINAGERVTQSDIGALDQTSEATQAEDAMAPAGGGSWLPDWVTKPLKIYGQVYQPPGVGLALKMRDDATKFAKEKENAKKVGPFAPVTQRAIQALIANPSQAETFDKMFGPGEAEKWLPKKQKPVEASQ